MITVLCRECNKSFGTYPSKIAIGRGVYCSRQCSDKHTLIKQGDVLSKQTQFKKGMLPHNFKGYRYTQSRKQSGVYKMLYMPEHPYATKSGHVREHRYIMEQHIGRYLKPNEIIDHINMDTLNNDITNLRLMEKRDHDRMNTPLNIHRRWEEGRK